MILIIGLTFVGQSIAYTYMSYHMVGMKGNTQSQNMSVMDHSNHKMVSHASIDLKNSVESPSEDCCTKTCKCFMGGCSNIAVIMISPPVQSTVVNLSSKIHSYSRLALSQRSKSLYRPPIIS